jgi:hypothetical protein
VAGRACPTDIASTRTGPRAGGAIPARLALDADDGVKESTSMKRSAEAKALI